MVEVRQGGAEDDEVEVCCNVDSITEHPCPEDHGFRCVPKEVRNVYPSVLKSTSLVEKCI